MKAKKSSKVFILLLITALAFGACSSNKYCKGGKRKHNRMKKDTNMMVFD